MIICVSLNPAIDRRLQLDRLITGRVNRAQSARPAPGGKAAHVAMAAHALGEAVKWIGFLGGATGQECEEGLLALAIPVMAVRTKEATRINLEIIDEVGEVTEILEPGGVVRADEVRAMLASCEALFEQYGNGAQVVLSGSLPPEAPVDLYAKLTRAAHHRGCSVLLDTSGAALREALAASPDLVKPNRQEAAMISGLPVEEQHQALAAARWMIAQGAKEAAISLGADGVVWLKTDDPLRLLARPPMVAARSTVGCGDAMVAGLAVARSRGLEADEMLRLAMACGAANCLAEAPGMIQAAEVERLLSQVEVESILEN